MRSEKLQQFVNILARDKVIYFYLYNTQYKIKMLDNDYYRISSYGSTYYTEFHKIVNLFDNYYIYGQTLRKCVDDIVLVD